ncbi:MAG: deoxyribonuclease V [candidate division Zixibacteria bacterium]|nr:deoxyribonuclease V [candidate division Zixibacteria bacterium]
MQINELHEWPKSREEAEAIQEEFCDQVQIESLNNKIKLIAGVDTAFNPSTEKLHSAVCLFTYPGLKLCQQSRASMKATFPYIPGLHAFREGPAILKALKRLTKTPDIIIFAGHGIAHTRRFGLACHMGLLLNCPTIGCARKRLAGQYDEVGPDKGDSSELFVQNEQVGFVYRSRQSVKPIFISPGHLCTNDDAVRILISCLCGYRLPEPLRAAHRLANRDKREGQ